MYENGRKLSEQRASTPSLTETDDHTTTSLSSANDIKISPVLHQQSPLLPQKGKQEERRQGKSLADVVAKLRQQRDISAEEASNAHSPSCQKRSVPLDPETTAQAFRKALRTNSSMNQSKRVNLQIDFT